MISGGGNDGNGHMCHCRVFNFKLYYSPNFVINTLAYTNGIKRAHDFFFFCFQVFLWIYVRFVGSETFYIAALMGLYHNSNVITKIESGVRVENYNWHTKEQKGKEKYRRSFTFFSQELNKINFGFTEKKILGEKFQSVSMGEKIMQCRNVTFAQHFFSSVIISVDETMVETFFLYEIKISCERTYQHNR